MIYDFIGHLRATEPQVCTLNFLKNSKVYKKWCPVHVNRKRCRIKVEPNLRPTILASALKEVTKKSENWEK